MTNSSTQALAPIPAERLEKIKAFAEAHNRPRESVIVPGQGVRVYSAVSCPGGVVEVVSEMASDMKSLRALLGY